MTPTPDEVVKAWAKEKIGVPDAEIASVTFSEGTDGGYLSEYTYDPGDPPRIVIVYSGTDYDGRWRSKLTWEIDMRDGFSFPEMYREMRELDIV